MRTWAEYKAIERKGKHFIKSVLELSGHNVFDYGIEKQNLSMASKLKMNYKCSTNRRLLSTPDFLILDKTSQNSRLVEVKFRSLKIFMPKTTNFTFRYGLIKDYLEFWSDALLAITFPVKPYCLCVRISDINWNIHSRGKVNYEGKMLEAWNFNGIMRVLNDEFEIDKSSFACQVNVLRGHTSPSA